MIRSKTLFRIIFLLLLGLVIVTMIYKPDSKSGSRVNLSTIEKSALEAEQAGNIKKAAAIWQNLSGYDSRSPKYLYHYGRALSWRGQYGAAQSFLERALHFDPDYVDALLQLGLTELKMGRFEEAADTFRQVLALDPENTAVQSVRKTLSQNEIIPEQVREGLWWGDDFALARLLVKQTEDLYRDRKYENMFPYLSTLHLLHPQFAVTYYWLGRTYIALNEDKKAEAALLKSLALDPKDLETLTTLAKVQLFLGKQKAGKPVYGQEVKDPQSSAMVRAILVREALEYEREGKEEKAAELWERLADEFVDSSYLNLRAGLTYYRRRKFEEAVSWLQRSLAINPSQLEALVFLGLAKVQLNKPAEGAVFFTRALELDPDYEAAQRGLDRAYKEMFILEGKKLEEEGKMEEALEFWTMLAKKFPKSAFFSYQTGYTHYRQEQYVEAAEWLQKSLAINPNHLDALVFLGLTKIRLDKLPEGAAIFARALKLDPDYEAAQKGLDRAYTEMFTLEGKKLEEEGKMDEALGFWTMLAKRFPNNAFFSYQTGYTHYRKEQYAEAAEWLQKSLAIDPDATDTLVILSYSQVRLNKFAEALEGFYRVLELDPDYTAAEKGIEIAKRKWLEYEVETDLLAQKVLKRAEKLTDEFKYDPAYHLWVWLYNRHPTYPSFVYELGNNYLVRGKLIQANWILRRAIELEPKSENPWVKLGYTYLYRACLYQACSIFEYSTQKFSKSGQAHFGMARTYRDARLVCKAKEAYKKAVHHFDYYPDQAVAERELQHLRRHTDPNFYAFTAYGREVETDIITDVKSADRRTLANQFEYWQPWSQRTRLMAFAEVGFDREIAIQQNVNNFFVDEHAGGVGFDHYATPWLNLQAFIRVKQGIDARKTSQFPFQNTTRVEPRSLLQYRYLSHRLFLSSEVDSFIVKNFARFNSYYLTRWKNEFTYQYQWRPMAMFLGCTGFIRKYDDGNQQLDGLIYFQFPYPKYVEWLWFRQELRTGGFTNTRVDYYSYRELWEYSVQAAAFKYVFPTTYMEVSYLHAWRNTRDLQQPVTSPVFVPKLFLNINKVFFNLKQVWKSDLELWIRTDYYWDSSDYTAYTIRGQLYYNF